MTEINPVSETLCFSAFLEYQTMDKIQKPNNSDMQTHYNILNLNLGVRVKIYST
jgi:hypothetical protein